MSFTFFFQCYCGSFVGIHPLHTKRAVLNVLSKTEVHAPDIEVCVWPDKAGPPRRHFEWAVDKSIVLTHSG